MQPTPAIHWPAPAGFPALGGEDIHLWCSCLDEPGLDAAGAEKLLSPAEQARARAFHFKHDRIRSVLARATLRRLLGRYLGADPAALAFTYGPSGKPTLGAPAPIQFNLSHAGPLCLFAFARAAPLGIDLEQIRDLTDLDLMEDWIFTAEELRAHQALPAARRLPAFYRRWTEREATGKLRGVGLDLPFPGEARPAEAGATPCQLAALEPAPEFLGTLAYLGAPAPLFMFRCTGEVLGRAASPEGNSASPLPWSPHRQAASPCVSFQ